MKKLVILALFLTHLTIANAQNQDVINTLTKHKLSEDILKANMKDMEKNRAFKLKKTSVTSNDTKVQIATYDPAKPSGQKWTLVSINDKPASESQSAKFNKLYDTDVPPTKVDQNSWKIIKEDADYLVLGFKFDQSSLVKSNNFLSDCKGQAYINLKTGKLERSEILNEKPLKIKILNLKSLDMDSSLIYNETTKNYQVEKTSLTMLISMLGQQIETQEINEYSYR